MRRAGTGWALSPREPGGDPAPLQVDVTPALHGGSFRRTSWVTWLGAVLSAAPVDGAGVPQACVSARAGVSMVPVSLGRGDLLGRPSSLVSRTGFAWDRPAGTPTSWVAPAPSPRPHGSSGAEVDPGRGFGAEAPSLSLHRPWEVQTLLLWAGRADRGAWPARGHVRGSGNQGRGACDRETPILEVPALTRLVWSPVLCPS